MPERKKFDVAGYIESTRTRGCFICGLVSGDPAFAHHVVYEDDFAIAFLNKYPPLMGYVLVCPKAHLEQVTGDVSLADYLRLQAVVYAVSQALRTVFEVERVYVLSLGSQQANRHVPLACRASAAPTSPLEDQQFVALDADRAGYLALDHAETSALASRIAEAIRSP